MLHPSVVLVFVFTSLSDECRTFCVCIFPSNLLLPKESVFVETFSLLLVFIFVRSSNIILLITKNTFTPCCLIIEHRAGRSSSGSLSFSIFCCFLVKLVTRWGVQKACRIYWKRGWKSIARNPLLFSPISNSFIMNTVQSSLLMMMMLEITWCHDHHNCHHHHLLLMNANGRQSLSGDERKRRMRRREGKWTLTKAK